ncbi:MAG: transglutaminase-like cysteine peptidase [Ahrensia sp.]|nr:transglutaminase-like cysteine peptidase [Ahrensia sp.]
MSSTKSTLIAAAFAVACMATPSAAQGISHMKTGSITSQPIGHAMFCQQLPQECSVRSASSKAPKLTRERWNDLVEVNNFANFTIEPVTDQEGYGVEEHWTYPRTFGDCEDYVLLKRFMLLQRGWPESSLLITVVKQPNGDGHAVLTVRTSRADYVLDNLQTKILPWNKTRYRFLKRQSDQHTGKWARIYDNRRQVASY